MGQIMRDISVQIENHYFLLDKYWNTGCRPQFSAARQTYLRERLKLQETNLREFRLRETRLAHLRRLAHVDVALGQGTLGERLGTQILACLADTHVPSMRSTV